MSLTDGVQFRAMETHVECLVWDPFPTIDKCRYDRCSREAIIQACIEKYHTTRYADGTMLIAVVIYDINVIELNGVKYKSEPLNKVRWSWPK